MSSVLVDPAWLAERLGGAGLVVCDVRSVMGHHDPRGAYRDGHLPGAVFVELDTVLADPPGGTAGRHPLPSPERFAADLGWLGIGDDATVVAYDDRAGAFAARLVWMLRILGQDARLLDGGLAGWTGPLETDDVVLPTVDRTVRPWPAGELADADDVDAHLAAGGVVVDARDPARFRGEHEPIDPVAGHVPGAINRFFGDHLVDGRFRPVDELRANLAPLAADHLAVVYCGSGVTACHDALAAEHAGLPRPRVYVGSWSGWTADPNRPVATGDA